MNLRILTLFLLCFGTPLFSQTITLVSPNGNERYSFNDTIDIRWSGVGPTIPVRIELSNNGGQTFTPIADSATGNRYRWPVAGHSGSQFKVRLSVTARGQVARVYGEHLPEEYIGYNSPAAVSPSGDTVAHMVLDRQTGYSRVVMRRAATGDTIRSMVYPYGEIATGVQFSPNGDRVVCSMTDGRILIWQTRNGKQVNQIDAYRQFTHRAVFSPSGDRLVALGDDRDINTQAVQWGMIYFYGLVNHAGSRQRRAQQKELGWSIEFSPDGQMVVSTVERGAVRVWTSPLGDSIARIEVGSGLTCATFSPDQSVIAAAGETGEIFLIDTATWSVKSVMRGGQRRLVRSIAFSPDGQYLVSGSEDSTALVWDMKTETPVLTLSGSNSFVSTVKFTARGQILTGSYHCTARLWDVSMPSADTSEATFSIGAQRYNLPDVDFGRVLVGSGRDSTLEAFVCNDTTVPVRLREITFLGDGIGDFELKSNLSLPLTIPPGECQALDFGFTPSAVAARSIQVRFVIDDDTMYTDFRGEGVSTLGIDLTGASGYSLRAVPNPASGVATLEYALARPGDVDLRLVDARGSVLWQQRQEGVGTGPQRLAIDLADIASGQYWLLLQSGTTSLRRQLIIIK